MAKGEILNIRISADLKAELQAAAEKEGRTTRELGLEGDGSVVHLNRFFEGPVELATYRYAEDYDRSWRRKDYIWQGSSFTWEASPDEKAFWGKDICSQLSQIAINVEDYI